MDGEDTVKTAEFCPKCYHPLEPSEDDARLCGVCSWFGDQSEICAAPPTPDDLELAFSQLLALYRDVCRMELMAEQLAEGREGYEKSLRAVRARANHARHSILHLYREIRKRNKDDEETPA